MEELGSAGRKADNIGGPDGRKEVMGAGWNRQRDGNAGERRRIEGGREGQGTKAEGVKESGRDLWRRATRRNTRQRSTARAHAAGTEGHGAQKWRIKWRRLPAARAERRGRKWAMAEGVRRELTASAQAVVM